MADKAHVWTDKEIERIQRVIARYYAKASKDVNNILTTYAKSIKGKSDELYKAIGSAKDDKEREAAKKAYRRFYTTEVLTSKEFIKTADEAAQRLYEANAQSAEYINSKTAKIYAENYNASTRSIAKNVEGLTPHLATPKDAENYADLTKQDVDKKKDKRWNVSNIKKGVLACAVAGYALDKLVKTTSKNTTQKNYNSAMRQASDMAGDAESLGRLDSYCRAEDEGYDIKKVWVATLDNRTRESHVELDGKSIALGEEFLDGLSRPRDPNGELAEICNCRCTLTYDIGQKKSDTRADRIGDVKGSYKHSSSFAGTATGSVKNMTYKEWQKWRS